MLALWSLVPLPFLNLFCTSGSSKFMYFWSLDGKILSITLLVYKMSATIQQFPHSLVLPFFGIGIKTDLFQSCGHCWVFQFCWKHPHSKHPLPTTQEKTLHMDITRWSTPKSDWLYSLQPKMEKHYIVNKNKTRCWLWLRSWTPYYQIQTEIEENRENH